MAWSSMMAILIMVVRCLVWRAAMSALSYFRRSVVAFPLAALAALAMFVISEVSYQDATSSLDSLGERRRSHPPEPGGQEPARRGDGPARLPLSNRQDYLAPYRDAQDGLRESTEWLRTLLLPVDPPRPRS
jgi:hypothetical protein